MAPNIKYQRRKNAARFLLLAGYLVFFATQFNGKYYAVANFFVYKTGLTAKAALNHQSANTNGLAFHAPTQRPAHLTIDKRFSYKGTIQPLFMDHEAPVPTYIIITRKALPPPVVYSTPDLPTNCFRGPPTA
jgi:hypothetical protein